MNGALAEGIGADDDGAADIDFDRLEMIRATPEEDDNNLLGWVIDTFIADIEQRMPRMHAACKQSDWPSLAEEAHRLYSGASNLGLIKISDICIELELEAANPEVDKSGLLGQMVEAYKRVLPELERQKSSPG